MSSPPSLPSKDIAEKYIDLETQMKVEIDNSKPIIFNGTLPNQNKNESILINLISQSYDYAKYYSTNLHDKIKRFSFKEKCTSISHYIYLVGLYVSKTISASSNCLIVNFVLMIKEYILLPEINIYIR